MQNYRENRGSIRAATLGPGIGEVTTVHCFINAIARHWVRAFHFERWACRKGYLN